MQIDFTGATWLQVAKWAQERIDALRILNDTDLDPVTTASHRGQIKAFKKLIGLPDEVARTSSTGSAISSFGGYEP